MSKPAINISQVRCLADKYGAGELEVCMQDELRKGSNACVAVQDQAAGVSILSMAGFVRSQMERDGLSVHQALRILGQRMRSLAGDLVETINGGC